MVRKDKSLRITEIIRLCLVGNVNLCAKYYRNPSFNCIFSAGGISLDTAGTEYGQNIFHILFLKYNSLQLPYINQNQKYLNDPHGEITAVTIVLFNYENKHERT